MVKAFPVEAVRERLKDVLRRPAFSSEPAPAAIAIDVNAPVPAFVDAKASANVAWERWVVYSEPGPLGRVPVLIARPNVALKPDGVRRPAVLVCHGTTRSKEYFAPHLARYARKGFLAVSFDNRYHGERGNMEDYMASLIRAYHTNSVIGTEKADTDEYPFVFDSTWDALKVIDMIVARDDADPARIGATGESLGGLIVWFAAAVDDRIRAVAPTIGVQGFQWALENEAWRARVDTIKAVFEAAAADDFGKGGQITTSVVEKVWRRILPGITDIFDAPSSLRCIAPRALLIMNGENDPRCPAKGVELAVEATKSEYERTCASPETMLWLHMEPGVGHQTTDTMWKLVDRFMEEHLKPSETLPASNAAANGSQECRFTNSFCTSCVLIIALKKLFW